MSGATGIQGVKYSGLYRKSVNQAPRCLASLSSLRQSGRCRARVFRDDTPAYCKALPGIEIIPDLVRLPGTTAIFNPKELHDQPGTAHQPGKESSPPDKMADARESLLTDP
jgi:hypothetical protein